MATLHSALKSLAPITYSEVPTDETELRTWMSDLFSQSQLILDSIPIPDPIDSGTRPPTTSASSVSSSTSEISVSSARSAPPLPEHQALQKEWGKPVKLGSKENALGMSVYKLSGKDGRGAWFARRSVHEGILFSKFKKAMEMEFAESLAVQGAPGEGNVRGIGGETKVEDVRVPGLGRVEVYRLSAQFPGPTTPRDFVTLLVTSEQAMKAAEEGVPVPRHYMVISKPCDHPETQPRSGFIRGTYESVEFIREVPRLKRSAQSMINLAMDGGRDDATEKIGNHLTTPSQSGQISASAGSASDVGRKRSSTVPAKSFATLDIDDVLPVEWIMVTRSDPGGSVPRFMVERGTPSSICADAEKLLDWACKQDFDDEMDEEDMQHPPLPKRPQRRDSSRSFRSSRVVGAEDHPYTPSKLRDEVESDSERNNGEANTVSAGGPPSGLMGAVNGAAQYLSSYTPQIVLDHLPGRNTATAEESDERHLSSEKDDEDIMSTASFESADSHLGDSSSDVASPTSSRTEMPQKSDVPLTQQEKELRKLEQRRADLENRFAESRTKLEREVTTQTAKEEAAKQKAIDKHERELQKHREKYDKELKKLTEKHEKERKKMEAQQKRQADKDEKARLTRERDEARQELEILKKEAVILRQSVEDLQAQNTVLVARLGAVGVGDGVSSVEDALSLSRKASRREKGHKASGSVSASIKSQ